MSACFFYESLLSQRLLHSVIVILPKKSLVKISGATLFFKYNYLSMYEKRIMNFIHTIFCILHFLILILTWYFLLV